MNFESEWLQEAGLLNAPSLQSLLGVDWTEEEVRYLYPTASANVLKGRNPELLHQLADMDGHSRLYKIGPYYLFESIDIWMHEVYASEPLMLEIIMEMNRLKQ